MKIIGLETETEKEEKFLETKIEDLDLSVRTYCLLHKAKINTVAEMLSFYRQSPDEAVKKFGHKAMDEITQKLSVHGVDLDEHQIDMEILKGLNEQGIAYLACLPNENFVNGTAKYEIIGNTVAKYLQMWTEVQSRTAYKQEQLDGIEESIEQAKAEYKELVDQKRTATVNRGEFVGRMFERIDEVRHYHHNPTQKTHEGHTHNPVEREL